MFCEWMISFSHIYYDKHESGFLLLPMIPLFLDHVFVKKYFVQLEENFWKRVVYFKNMGFFWFSNAVLFKCYYVHWKKSHSFGTIYKNDVDTFMFKNFDKVCYLSKSYTCLFSCWCINAFLIKPTENLNNQAINTYWCIVHVYTKSYTFIYQVLCTRYVQKRRNFKFDIVYFLVK